MQRTYVKHQSRIENAFKHRTSSLYGKSPEEVLELIKDKRSSINNYGRQKRNSIDNDNRPIRLCLPKISAANSSLDFEKPQYNECYSRDTKRSLYTENISHTKQSNESIDRPFPVLHKTELDEVSEDEDDEMLEHARCTTVLTDIMREFPRLHKEKNLENLLPLVEFLMVYNPFFKNLPTTVVFAFLKICRIREYSKGRWAYKKNDSLSSFYVILWGKVKIVNMEKKYKKVSVKGETLSEHLLFTEYNDINRREQGAKALTHCFLLEVDYKVYLKLYKELVLKGYKAEFLTMETLIRRNFILKQGLKERCQKLM